MPSAQTKLAEDTPWPEAVAVLNDNMDKTVGSINDLGAKFSGSFVSGAVTVNAGKSYLNTIGLVDSLNSPQYIKGKVQIVPRFEMWIDNNGNDAYLWGYSNSSAAFPAIAGATVQRRAAGGADLVDATVFIYNLDSSNHTYYYVLDMSYLSSPSTQPEINNGL